MNVSRFMNLATIFSLDLESQSTGVSQILSYVFHDPLAIVCTCNLN